MEVFGKTFETGEKYLSRRNTEVSYAVKQAMKRQNTSIRERERLVQSGNQDKFRYYMKIFWGKGK